MTVWLAEHYTRAAPGGTGEAKSGGNNAAALASQLEAVTAGCDQAVWLDTPECRRGQWREGAEAGQITEAFACGTAAVITPIGKVKSASAQWTIGDGPGPVSMKLREALLATNATRRRLLSLGYLLLPALRWRPWTPQC